MVRLHINIDHVATLRQARRSTEPNPVAAAALAERSGADGITVHLREDRRHIQDRDLHALRHSVRGLLNLEMALSPEILAIALTVRPDEVCLVPEKRQEITTEGGLDAVRDSKRLREFVPKLQKRGILVSLFLDPESEQIQAAAAVGADFVELHTGSYARASGRSARREARTKNTADRRELERLQRAAALARKLGLRVNAGHGLNYNNVGPITQLEGLEELNIGHAIVSHAVFVGLGEAVRQMRERIDAALRAPARRSKRKKG